MDLAGILKEAEEKMRKTFELTQRELGAIRSSRASPMLLEGIKVDYYGTPTPLKQLAAISAPDARLLVVQPWDPSVAAEIERAILKSDLGVTPQNDGKLIRIGIPQLSHERREELAKLAKKMAEDSRVSIRSIRRDANEHIKKLEKDKVIAEDDSRKSHGEIQRLTDKYIGLIDQHLATKERELLEV